METSKQLNRSNSKNEVSCLPGFSFVSSFAHFLANVKNETKDIFELLNYPCVYHNPKKRISLNDIPILQKNYSLRIISKKDKVHLERLAHKKKELMHMLENAHNYNNLYKMDASLVSILENMILLHLFNEYKIQNILAILHEHNFPTAMMNSDLPNSLIPLIELQERDNNFLPLEIPLNLSASDHRLLYLLKLGNIDVKLFDIDKRQKELASTKFTNIDTDCNLENSNTSENSASNYLQSNKDDASENVENEGGRLREWERERELDREWSREREMEIARRKMELVREREREKEKEEREREREREREKERERDREREREEEREKEKENACGGCHKSFDKNAFTEQVRKEDEIVIVEEPLECEREAIEGIGLSAETLLLLNLLPKKRRTSTPLDGSRMHAE